MDDKNNYKMDYEKFENLVNSLVDIQLIREFDLFDNYELFIHNFFETLKYFESSMYKLLSQFFRNE